MKTTFISILAATLAASFALAHPLTDEATLFSRGGEPQQCNMAPHGSAGKFSPMQSPSNCNTAQSCQQACKGAKGCQSFTFGLPQAMSAPQCKLFSCAADQVPSQGDNQNVFDLACSSVPSQTPSHDNPIGNPKGGH